MLTRNGCDDERRCNEPETRMNIDLLIKMANEISAFFAAETDQEQAVRAVANHLQRFWEPRMRAQIIAYCEQRQGAGLVDLAKGAVALLANESKAGVTPTAGVSPKLDLAR